MRMLLIPLSKIKWDNAPHHMHKYSLRNIRADHKAVAGSKINRLVSYDELGGKVFCVMKVAPFLPG